MTYDARERSLADGQPLRLYLFTRGVRRWTYSGTDRDIVHLDETYKGLRGGIGDNGVRQTGQAAPDAFKLTAPADLEVAQLYRGAPPSVPVSLTVFALHAGLADYVVIWAGEVRSVRWPALDRCEVSCSPLTSRMEMQGLRLSFERGCPHGLGTPACGVALGAHRIDASVQALDGASVSNDAMASHPAGHFTGGYVEWDIGGGEYDRRGIEQHSGAVLYLLGGTTGLKQGQALRVYPGCRQTTAGCKAFDNLPNYGGIPHLAGESPFDGRNVF